MGSIKLLEMVGELETALKEVKESGNGQISKELIDKMRKGLILFIDELKDVEVMDVFTLMLEFEKEEEDENEN